MKKLLSLLWVSILLFISCKDDTLENSLNQSAELKRSGGRASAVSANTPIVLGYFPSWSENWTSPTNVSTSKLATLPSHINHVFLAFAKPNLTYIKGSFDLAGTGIQVPYDGVTLKAVVAALKNKNVKVIVSIGGETYWGDISAYNINYQQIKDFVDDFGFAGIDWDFEPDGSFANIGSSLNVNRMVDFINNSRKLMPKSDGYIIACAPAGCGAVGGQTNDDPTSPYAYGKRNTLTGESDSNLYNFSNPNQSISIYGFASSGHMIPVFARAGNNIDLVAFQGYNVGAIKDRTLMYNSYAYYANKHGFKVAAGIHVPNEPWGPYYTYSSVVSANYAMYIYGGGRETRAGKGDGIMIWQLLQQSAVDTKYTGITYLNVVSKVLNGQTTSQAITNAFDYETGGGGGGGGSVLPSAPTVSLSSVYLNNPIAGTSPSGAGTLIVFRDGVEVSKVVVGSAWSYTPTVAGTYTFKIQTSAGLSPASSAVVAKTNTITPPPSGSGCDGVPDYDIKKSYPTAGTRVVHNGKIYENKWWVNSGDFPDPTTQWGVWKFISNCSGGSNVPAAPTVSASTVVVNTSISGTVASTGTLLVFKGTTQLTSITLSSTTWKYTPTSIGTYTFKLQTSAGVSVASSEVIVTQTTSPTGTGTGGCGYPAYDITKAYPNTGTNVYYNGKIYKNKWYINPGEAPNPNNQWDAWAFVSNCN